MPRDRQPAGSCARCQGSQLTCSYNHFEQGALEIDSWEHKCPDCGQRDTTAYRTDEEDSLPADGNTKICPYCGRQPTGA